MREPSEWVIIARNSMPVKSPAMAMFLEPFKAAAAEGAAVELKLRLLAGTIPGLQKYAHQKRLEDIEGDLARHLGDSLSPDEKEILRLCRQLRSKVLHTDFRAARGKLKELGVETPPGGVRKIDLPVVTQRFFLLGSPFHTKERLSPRKQYYLWMAH